MNKFFAILVISGLLFACNNQNDTYWTVNSSDIKSIEDLSEGALYEFYKIALDTILKENFLEATPEYVRIINDTSHERRDVTMEDQLFFDEQLKRFEDFKWDSTKVDVKIFPRKYRDLINEDIPRGWQEFRDNHHEYVHYISIPLFSRDFKKVYVEYGEQWYTLNAQGYVYIFEFEDDKWILKKKLETWQS